MSTGNRTMDQMGAPPPSASGTPATGPGATVRGATFRYSAGPAGAAGDHGIDDVSFTAGPGTVTLLCGPSGSGKTTALRLLNGLVPHFHDGPLSGRVTVGGLDVAGAALHDVAAVSATVFQNPRTQFFTPTVRGELAFACENLGVDPDDIRRRMDVAAAATGIGDLMDRELAELSGGELQRVACACAVTSGAGTLLFDEPTSNLSPAGIESLRSVIAELKTRGHAIVIAEHRLSFLRCVADSVLLLRDGRIARRFTGDEFFAMPDHERRAAGLRRLGDADGDVPPPPPGCGESDGGADRGEAAGGEDRGDAAGAERAGGPASAGGLRLRGLRFAYGGDAVLDIPDLTFPAGRVTALTGPNGIGKTTLARILSGLATPAKGGSITLAGRPATAKSLRRDGYIVMQDTGRQLFAESVADEITLGLKKKRREGIDVDAILRDFDLGGFADRHPHSLSGGQRQRLVMATATVQRKRVHIFDEPTSGVGLAHLTTIGGHMRRLAAGGAVVVVITHDDELIAECADHAVDLSDPRINRAARGGRAGTQGGRAEARTAGTAPPAATDTATDPNTNTNTNTNQRKGTHR